MNVLVGCEFSGRVREAFKAQGHNAFSCDWLESEIPGGHYRRDIFEVTDYQNEKSWKWDMLVAFPPCTHLASSGARWFKEKTAEQEKAIQFVRKLWRSNIERIAIENPIGVLSTKFKKPDQIVQPWQFGEGETKATCLWLKNLPKLVPTGIIPESERKHSIWREPPSENRWKNRSRTFQGIADAMARQWSGNIVR